MDARVLQAELPAGWRQTNHLCASRSLHTFRPMDGVPCDKRPTDGQTEEGTVSAHFCHFPKVTIRQPVRLRKLSQVRFRPQSTRSSTELGSKGFPQKHQRKMFGTWPWGQMDIWKTEPLDFWKCSILVRQADGDDRLQAERLKVTMFSNPTSPPGRNRDFFTRI